MKQWLSVLVLVTCVWTPACARRGHGKGHAFAFGQAGKPLKGHGYAFAFGKERACQVQRDVPEEDVPQVDVEPVSQARTIVGAHTVDVGACPVGSCHYDKKLPPWCPLDGLICAETEETEVDLGEFGKHRVDRVTACKCCKNTGITIGGKIIDAATEAVIPGADLKSGLKATTSDADGSFSFSVRLDTARLVIHAYHSGYVAAQKVVKLPSAFSGQFDVVVAMVKLAEAVDLNSNEDNEMPVSSDPDDPEKTRASIFIPAGSFKSGRDIYDGIVKLSINFLDTSDPYVDMEIPAEFVTEDGDPLITDGLIALTFTTDTGGPLSMGPVIVRVRGNMRLWRLSDDGRWKLINSRSNRKKRQIGLTEWEIFFESGRWINIDKIPGAPKCYFKSRVFDLVSNNEIPSSATASFQMYAVGYTTASERLRFYLPSTDEPANTCYEVRCPDIANPADLLVGFIAMESFEFVSVGGFSVPLFTTLFPRYLVDYPAPLYSSLSNVQYEVAYLGDEAFVNLISNSGGPFYTDKKVCELSTVTQPSFHFLKPPLPSYVAYPDDTKICTSRVGFFDNYLFFDILGELDALPVVTAISTWTLGGNNYFYTDTTVMEPSDVGGVFVYICISYRCSTTDATTTVYLDIDIPLVNSVSNNGTASENRTASFGCYGNCETENCFNPDTGLDGSFMAPVDIADGPDFFQETPNSCARRSMDEKFAAKYHCFARKWRGQADDSTRNSTTTPRQRRRDVYF